MTDQSFTDPESQRRLEQLIRRFREHCRAASQRRKRTEVRLVIVADNAGRIGGESGIDRREGVE